jgi:hypothetical protein
MSYRANILARWDHATPLLRQQGRVWYANAHNALAGIANQYGYSTDTICAVCAVLSPGYAWQRNLAATHLITSMFPVPVTVGVYGKRNIDKARRLLAGETPTAVLSGPKVTAFYHALRTAGLHPTAVVLDRHMYRVIRNTALPESRLRPVFQPARYERLASIIRTVARTLAVAPSVLQATLWLSWLAHGVIDVHTQPASVAA